MRPLPPACRWIDYPDKSCLMWHAGCVAVVTLAGEVTIQWGKLPTIHRRAASLEQGKRHAGQWIAGVRGLPPGKRAMAMRAQMQSAGPRLIDDAAWEVLIAPRPAAITPRPSRGR